MFAFTLFEVWYYQNFFCFRTKDYYHTCYCLSGLSVAQHFADDKYTCTCVVGNKDLNEVVSILPEFSIYSMLHNVQYLVIVSMN